MTYYKQCTFKSGSAQTTAWIEERGAKVGTRMTFKDDGDDKRIWTVLSVGDSRITEAQAKNMERQHVKHREFSDI